MPPKAKGNELVSLGEITTALSPNSGGVPSVAADLTDIAKEGAEGASSTSGAVGPSSDTVSTDTAQSEVIGEAGRGASLAPAALFDVSTNVEALYADQISAFRGQYPKLVTLWEATASRGVTVTGVRITSRADGFRRAGLRHPMGASDYPLSDFDPAQLEAMINEPALTVELL